MAPRRSTSLPVAKSSLPPVSCPDVAIICLYLQLIYNVVLVSGVQNSDSILLQIILLLKLLQNSGYIVLCCIIYLCCLSILYIVQFTSVAQSCLTLCDPMNCSRPGLAVHHQLPESTKTHVYRVSDAIQPSHPLSSPSPPALNLSQHQGHFK